MPKKNSKEEWKKVKFKFKITRYYKLEVSNLGRLKSYNSRQEGMIRKASMLDGYPVITIKFAGEINKKTGKPKTINYYSMIHNLVATYFVSKPSKKHTVVSHMDHDRTNNNASNLKWMTPEENFRHQKKSPKVVKYFSVIKSKIRANSSITKLDAKKVMQIKKLINEEVQLETIARRYKVSGVLISHIKSGKHWDDVKAAK
jgi:hypothetical protein